MKLLLGVLLIFSLVGCTAQLTFIDNTDGKMYFGQTPSATSSTAQATALIGGISYSGPWVYSAQGGSYSLGFAGLSGTAFSGAKSASFYGTGTSSAFGISSQGNGLLNMTGSDGSFIRCVFEFNTQSSSGIGKCLRNDNRQYDLTVVRGAAAAATETSAVALSNGVKQLSSNPVNQEISPSRNPDIASWNDRSILSANQGDWVEAIRTSSVAITADPSYSDAFVNRCRAYIGYGDLAEASKDCNQALKLAPSNLVALNNLGVIALKQKNEVEALTMYEKACLAGFQLSCDNFKKIKGYAPNDTSDFVKSKNEEVVKNFSQKNWVAVIAITSEIIKIAPENSDAYVSRSGAYQLIRAHL